MSQDKKQLFATENTESTEKNIKTYFLTTKCTQYSGNIFLLILLILSGEIL